MFLTLSSNLVWPIWLIAATPSVDLWASGPPLMQSYFLVVCGGLALMSFFAAKVTLPRWMEHSHCWVAALCPWRYSRSGQLMR